MEYYSAIKKNNPSRNTTPQRNLKIIKALFQSFELIGNMKE
jgi:hypothetical protein